MPHPNAQNTIIAPSVAPGAADTARDFLVTALRLRAALLLLGDVDFIGLTMLLGGVRGSRVQWGWGESFVQMIE